MELANTSAFAVLQRATKRYSFKIVSSLEGVILSWNSSTRVSPVFPISADLLSPVEATSFRGQSAVFFIGPINPGEVAGLLAKGDIAWATLGAYNLLVRTTPARREKLKRWLEKRRHRYEVWTVKGGVVMSPVSGARSAADPKCLKRLAQTLKRSVTPDEKHSLTEYCSLMASALVRATAGMPSVIPDLEQTQRIVESQLDQPDLDGYAKVGLLTTVNAALARLTSDSLSGSSSLLETECHAWPHSLLGIGVANMALARIRTFVHNRLATSLIPDRLDAYEAFSAVPGLQSLRADDPFWSVDHLKTAIPKAAAGEPLFSPLTYFSGRDHFRSSLNTLSAPTAAISGCNSVRWSLMTLTHEISHIILRGVMATLYPDPSSAEAVKRAGALMQSQSRANLLEEIRHLILGAVLAMDKAHRLDFRESTTKFKIAINDLPGILRQWHHEVEEIMTHIFDFLYFYNLDEERYLRGIWLSWSVIPNIGNKIPQYIIRSLCALMSKSMKYGSQTEEVVRKRLAEILKSLVDEPGQVNYVAEAIKYLEANFSDIDHQLIARRNLVRVARTFLYSEDIAAQLGRETRIVGGQSARKGYDMRPRDVDIKPIDNPLRFVSVYTDAHSPNEAVSVWMLYVLAFSEAADGAAHS